MKGLKKILAVGSIAMASAFNPLTAQNPTNDSERIEAKQNASELDSLKIVNLAGDPTFSELLKSQLKIMAGTKQGQSVLTNVSKDVKCIIKEKPDYAEEAAFCDGEDCVIYDETLISTTCGPAILIAHEMRHAIQWEKYIKEYDHMPTEQQIIHTKMTEIETRLQDVLMQEELYNQKALGTRTYKFATADWRDYRQLRESIRKKNPTLSDDQIERMTRTQFVIDTWQGNYRKKIYDQRDDGRSLKAWIGMYNEKALQFGNKRCLLIRPLPDLTVDESRIARHHEIMQEYIQRMGIDVSPDFFDTLDHDSSLKIVRNPKELNVINKHFDKKIKTLIMPRDDFVRVGGIVVCQDNSTVMFTPEKRKQFKKELSSLSTPHVLQQEGKIH